jgi:nodulation protein E
MVFGKHAYAMSLSSTKSMHGHAIGTSAAIEAVACIKAAEAGLMPPTIGLDEADPECDLEYVPQVARAKMLTYTMSNSFGLGGLNASLVFGPPPT